QLSRSEVELVRDVAGCRQRARARQRGEVGVPHLDRDPAGEQLAGAQPGGTPVRLVEEHCRQLSTVGEVGGEGLLVADRLLSSYGFDRSGISTPGEVVQPLPAGGAERLVQRGQRGV